MQRVEIIFAQNPADKEKIEAAISLCLKEKKKHGCEHFSHEGSRFYSMLFWVSNGRNKMALEWRGVSRRNWMSVSGVCK